MRAGDYVTTRTDVYDVSLFGSPTVSLDDETYKEVGRLRAKGLGVVISVMTVRLASGERLPDQVRVLTSAAVGWTSAYALREVEP